MAPGAHAILVLDGAGWHTSTHSSSRHTTSRFSCLPPYSPELNPVENVWEYLRKNNLGRLRVYETYDAIVDACCNAWNRFAERHDIVSSITSRQWAEVNP